MRGRWLVAGAVVASSLACTARSGGPKPHETVAWVIDDATVTAEGCDDAAPIVAATERSYAVGGGFVYRTDDDGATAELLDCPLEDGTFVFDRCAGTGEVGTVEGDTLTWDRETLVVDDGDCRLTLSEVWQVEDETLDGVLGSTIDVAATQQGRCRYTFEDEPVAPDGCRIDVDATLRLSDAER